VPWKRGTARFPPNDRLWTQNDFPRDQWQVTADQGATPNFPFYSMHAIGLQTNFMVPAEGFSAFFKYENEYLAKSTTQGRTFVFGLSWTLHDPRLMARRASSDSKTARSSGLRPLEAKGYCKAW